MNLGRISQIEISFVKFAEYVRGDFQSEIKSLQGEYVDLGTSVESHYFIAIMANPILFLNTKIE